MICQEDVLQEIQKLRCGIGNFGAQRDTTSTLRGSACALSPNLRLDPKGIWHSALHRNIKEKDTIEVTIRSEGKEQDVLPNSAFHSRSLQILLGLAQASRALDHAFFGLARVLMTERHISLPQS